MRTLPNKSNPVPAGVTWTPPPPIPEPFQASKRPTKASEILFGLGTVVLTLAQAFAFFVLLDDISSFHGGRQPETTIAASTSLILGAGAALGAIFVARRRAAQAVPLALLGLAGLVAGFAYTSLLERSSFRFHLEDAIFIHEGPVILAALLPFILFLVFIFGKQKRFGWGLGFGIVLGHVLFYGVPAVYLLFKLLTGPWGA